MRNRTTLSAVRSALGFIGIVFLALIASFAQARAGLPPGWRFETALPQGNDLLAAWAAGPDRMYAGGHGGVILRWDGQRWTVQETPTQKTIFALHGLSETDVWAVGGDAYASSAGDRSLILHFNGTTWTEHPAPRFGNDTYVLNSVHAIAPDDVWATQDGGTFLMHFDGVRWDWVSVPLPVEGSFKAVTSAGPDHLYVAGTHGQILHRDHGVWRLEQKLQSGGFSTSILNALWAYDGTQVFAAGNWSQIFRRNSDGTWSPLPIGASQPFGFGFLNVWGTSPTNLFLLDVQGIFHSDGVNPATRTSYELGMRRQWLGACGAGDRLYGVGPAGVAHEYRLEPGGGGVLSALAVGGQAELALQVRGAAAIGARDFLVYGLAWSPGSGAPIWRVVAGVPHRIPTLPPGALPGVDVKAVAAMGEDSAVVAWENQTDPSRGVHRWNGAGWTALSGAEGTIAFARSAGGGLWALTPVRVLRLEGTSWVESFQLPFGQFDTVLSCIWARSDTDVFIGARNGRILHYNGTVWSDETTPGLPGVVGIAGDALDTYAVGENGLAWRRTGGGWQQMAGVAAVQDEHFGAIVPGPDGVLAAQRTPSQYIGGGLGRVWRFSAASASPIIRGLSQPLEALVRTGEGHVVGFAQRDFIVTTAPDTTGTTFQRVDLGATGWQSIGNTGVSLRSAGGGNARPMVAVRRINAAPPSGPFEYTRHWQVLEDRFNTGSSIPPMQLRVDVDPGHLSPGTDIANLGLVRVADSVATTVSSVADAIGGRVETVGPVEFGSWTVAPVPGRPALRVRLNPAGGIDVEWPLAAVGFHLERADVLASGVTWEAVAEPVEVVDGWNRVRLPAGAAARFFRLR